MPNIMNPYLIISLITSCSAYLPDPENPVPVTYSLFSDTTDQVLGESIQNAVAAVEDIAEWSAEIPGATWIWSERIPSDQDNDTTVVFQKNFFIPGGVIEGSVEIAADHSVWVWVNNLETSCFREESSCSLYSQFSCWITDHLVPGMNTIKFSVTNPGRSDPEMFNPAGLLYKLTLRSLV
jgi:hypothetical protein